MELKNNKKDNIIYIILIVTISVVVLVIIMGIVLLIIEKGKEFKFHSLFLEISSNNRGLILIIFALPYLLSIVITILSYLLKEHKLNLLFAAMTNNLVNFKNLLSRNAIGCTKKDQDLNLLDENIENNNLSKEMFQYAIISDNKIDKIHIVSYRILKITSFVLFKIKINFKVFSTVISDDDKESIVLNDEFNQEIDELNFESGNEYNGYLFISGKAFGNKRTIVRVNIVVKDQNNISHPLLPQNWVYDRIKNIWVKQS
jgi:hypothetical protein